MRALTHVTVRDDAYEGADEIITVTGTSEAGLDVISDELTLTEDQPTRAAEGSHQAGHR